MLGLFYYGSAYNKMGQNINFGFMTEHEAIEAAQTYLQAWCRIRCSQFEAEHIPVNTSAVVENRATWQVDFLEPTLGSAEDDVEIVYVDELTAEVWETNRSTGEVTPRSWHDPWAEKRLRQMQTSRREAVEKYAKNRSGNSAKRG